MLANITNSPLKQYYLMVNNQKVEVNAQVYSEYCNSLARIRYQNKKIRNTIVSYDNENEKHLLNERVGVEYTKLHSALQTLDKEDVFIVKGLYFYNLTQKEIAKRLGLSQSAISYRKSRILNKLRNQLSINLI